jgi:hypothetical protein
MRNRFSLLTLGVVIALIVSGCDKLKNPTDATSAPPFPTLTLKGPNTNSSDAHAQQTKSIITTFNASVSPTYLTFLVSVNPTQNGDTWTWTVTQGTLTLTTTATKQNNGSNAWSAKLNGADPFTDTTYNNWIAFSGTATTDNKSGNLNSYRINTTTILGNALWTTDTTGKVTATFTSYENDAATAKGVVVNNADGSGELDLYTGIILTYKSTWVAAGSGTWMTLRPACRAPLRTVFTFWITLLS